MPIPPRRRGGFESGWAWSSVHKALSEFLRPESAGHAAKRMAGAT